MGTDEASSLQNEMLPLMSPANLQNGQHGQRGGARIGLLRDLCPNDVPSVAVPKGLAAICTLPVN
jgi:hypothetical protein